MDDKLIWLIILTLGQAVALALSIIKKLSKNPGNNAKPGKATTCIEHGNKLTELNTKVGELDKDLERLRGENREDHKQIFDKINRTGRK